MFYFWEYLFVAKAKKHPLEVLKEGVIKSGYQQKNQITFLYVWLHNEN